MDRDAILAQAILNLTPVSGKGAVQDRPIPSYDYRSGPPVDLEGRFLNVWNGDDSDYPESHRSGALLALASHLYHRAVSPDVLVGAISALDSEKFGKWVDRPRLYWELLATIEGEQDPTPRLADDYIFAGTRYYITKGAYYSDREGEFRGRQLSDFTFREPKVIRLGDELWFNGRVIRSDGYNLPAVFRIPTANFTANIQNLGGIWHGSAADLGRVLGWAVSTAPVLPGTNQIGWHTVADVPTYVASDGATFTAGGPETTPSIYLIRNRGVSVRTMFDTTPPPELVLRGVAEHLLNLNRPEVMWPVLGWACAAGFAPLIRKKVGHFPLLSVFGTPGGGKTMMVQQVLRFVRGLNLELLKADTPFTILSYLSSSNSVPVVYDEVRRNTRGGGALLEHAKEAYAGEQASRGTASQNVNVYQLSAPVGMVGEVDPRAADVALSDRFVSVELRPAWKRTPENEQAYAALLRLNDKVPAQFAYQLMQLTLDTERFEKLWTTACEVINPPKVNDRERDNLRSIYLGLLALAGMTGLDIQTCVETVTQSYSTLSSASQERVRPQFHTWLEQVSVLAHQGKLQRGTDYDVDMAGHRLRIVRAPVWSVYERELRLSAEVLNAGPKTLAGWLRDDDTGLVLDDAALFNIRNRPVRGFILDVNKMLELDLDCFGFFNEEDKVLSHETR